MYKIKALYPSYFMDKLISYVGLRLVNHFNDAEGVESTIVGMCSDRSVDAYMKEAGRPFYKDTFSKALWPFYRRILSEEKLMAMTEKKFLDQLRPGDIAYMFPAVSLNAYREAKRKGCIVVSERINTLRGNSKMLQDRECESLGVTPCHGISEESIVLENEKMSLCDYVFSPAPGITESLEAIGIEKEKIIETSYAMRKDEIIEPKPESDFESDYLRVVFVGSIGVRKGIHLLLSAWEKSKVNGQLTVVGRVSPEVSDIFDGYLKRNPSIKHVGFVDDLKPIYRNADLLSLTSVEEGSPLVTYLGFGASVPFMGSYMGAGGIVEDGVEGLIIDAHDEDGIIAGLIKFAEDKIFRKKASLAARKSAENYTWDIVGKKRAEELIKRIERNR